MNIRKFVVFDVETPNSRNHRMSAIGVSVVENGQIVKEWGTLVNPECHFDDFNIALTGITPEMAAAAPTFPEIWERLRPIPRVASLCPQQRLCPAAALPNPSLRRLRAAHFYRKARRAALPRKTPPGQSQG